MPVSTTCYKAETALEAAVLCNQQGLSYFKHIESTLQDLKGGSQDQPPKQRCSVEMMRRLITTIQEQLPCHRFWQVEVMVSVIKHIAASAQDGESSGLSVLLDNGLVEILAFVFEETSRRVSRNGKEADHEADHLIEVLFETVNDVAEYSGAARKLAVEAFCARLIKLVIDTRVLFHARMEAERTLNLLLEGCEDDDLSWVGKDPVIGKLMQHLAEFLPVAGDFEMQIAVTESLARMVTKSERKRRSPQWFPSKFISDAFLAIEDQQFDSDCRTFLNLLNENCQERSVYSFPCKKAYLGGCELRNPSEDKLSEFWVDFNAISQSITMYVADEDAASEEEGGLWETVTFSKDKVKEYMVKDDAEGCVHLVMTLTEPASSILAFCGSKNRTATIMFQPRTDLTDALAISLGLEMNSTPVEAPSSSHRSSVSKINVLVNRARNTSWGLSNMPQSFNDGYVDGGGSHEVQAEKGARPSGASHTSEAKATPVRRKISIPLVPMTTPSRTSLHSTASSVVSSVAKTPHSKPANQGFAQPRTPIGHHGSTKKVKTPLQVTVADKSSTSGTESDLEHPRSHSSTTPAKVSVTRNNIVCQSPVVQRESEEGALGLLPDSQEGARDDTSGKHQQGAVSKKMGKGKSDASAGKRGRDLEDQTNGKLATKLAKEKKGSGDRGPGKALKEDAIPGQSKRSSGEESSEAVTIANHPKKLSQDITEIPDTQESQNVISGDTEASQGSCHSKGRKKARKVAANPKREGSRKSTRNSKVSQMQSKEKAIELPQTLPHESKSNRGKKFKLYSDTSVLMESPASDARNEGRKTRENVKKPKRGNNVASDTTTETEEHPVTASKGKATSSKKGRKKKEQEDKKGTENQVNKAEKKVEMAPMKPKGASKKGGGEITAPLMIEDDLSQDFVVPKMTAKGKPTHGARDLQGDKMTSHDMMYNPDPQEEEEILTSRLPHIDERAAAQALAAENAEYCVPSSAPEERCKSSQDREEMIPDSQPLRKSFRRSGRFPSPLLSDITEESTMSKGSSGPKHAKQLQSPHTSCKSDNAPELLVIKSRSKPETAKADSTSVNQEEKDPYDFVDSASVSSLQVVSRKTHTKDGRGDADNNNAAQRQSRKTAGREKTKENMTADNDLGLEDDSQDEFASHSHTFGLRNNGPGKSQSKDQGKRRHSGKGPKKSPEIDEQQSTADEEDDLVTQKKPRQSSRRKMKGKLDSNDAYVQRIQREVKEKAAFVSRMQAQEEEYPDIEVARDVSHMTEAYDDTDISTFVKSVMKSLPTYKKDKDVLKKPVHREEKTNTRRAEMQPSDDDDEEAKQAEKKDTEVSGERARQSSPEARNKGSKSLPTDEIVQEDQQLHTKAKKRVASEARAARKEVSKGVENKSSKKSSRRSSEKSVRGDESLTEGEMSVDEMVSAHMDSILGGRRSDSLKKSASEKANEDRTKGRQMVSCMDRFEVDEEILKRAQDTISRRSKMIAALERSSGDLSDTEQDEGNDTMKTDKTGRKRSVEKNLSHTSDGTSNRAKRSSLSSIQGNQSPLVSASNKVLSSKCQKDREKCKQDGLDQSDDDDMYDYNLDLDDLRASRMKGSRARAEQKDRSTKKSKLTTPKTTSNDVSYHSSKNQRSMKEIVEQEDGRSEGAKPRAVAATVEKTEQSAAKSQVSKNGRTHFGSQIEDSDSEEIMETASTTPPDDTTTVVSVESFSNMCKDLLKSSGKGIAAGRERRKLQKVDYRELESSYSDSDDGSNLQTPGRCVKKTVCEKSARDVYEYREETSSCCTASIIEDSVSERSWLADRPKQKVSTYSKTKKEVFGLTKITKNLDTVKKPRLKPQVKDANAPRKKKSVTPKEQDEEVCPLYYCAEEEQEVKNAKKRSKKGTQQREQDEIDVHHEPVSKKPKSSCRRSLVECMSSMSSSISHLYNTSQEERDEDDGEEISDGTAEEQEKDGIPATPAMTIETVTSQMSAWTTPGSGTRTPRTPKQVSFVDELESLESDQEGHLELEYPFSGPSKNVRPSESTLKRKYAHLISNNDDDREEEEDSGEDIDEESEEQEKEVGQSSKEKQHGLNLSMRQASLLEPKILFKNPEPIDEPVQSEHSGEDGISDHSISSSWGQNLDFPAMQMPEMFGFMRNRLKQKMMEKRNQTQQLTETAIQSTQKQMNKLFLELHKARQRSQNDFQQKLLTELVGMESSLEKLGKIQAQNEHILKQYAKKSTQHVEQHLSKVEELHTTFLEKDARLGENVVDSLQQIISKDMKNMLKKMLQDMHQEQMKKTMQSLFLLR